MIMICRMSDTFHISTFLKTIGFAALDEGAQIRCFENLGDRVLSKNLKSIDGKSYGVGRYLSMTFDATPKQKDSLMALALDNIETLRVYTMRLKEEQYIEQLSKRLSEEFSPFRERKAIDREHVKAIWKHREEKKDFEENVAGREYYEEPHKALARLKLAELERERERQRSY